MPRYSDFTNVEPIIHAAEHWRNDALINDKSVFTDKTIWTLENINVLVRDFVENPDDGEGTYYEKLERQLDNSTPEVKQLASEMMWV